LILNLRAESKLTRPSSITHRKFNQRESRHSLRREPVQIENITPPPLKPGEVRVQVEAALTCDTDLKVFKRGYHARMIVRPAAFRPWNCRRDSRSPQSTVRCPKLALANRQPGGECFYCHGGQANPSQLEAPVFENMRPPSGLRLAVGQDDSLPGPQSL